MTSLLPVVTKDTANGAICEVIRQEIEGVQGDGTLVEWLNQLAIGNPAVVSLVDALSEGTTPRERAAALMGSAIAYRALSAQAEIEALNRMAKQ